METSTEKDITTLEYTVMRRATRYILNDYNLTYKSSLEQLNLLPQMYIFELTAMTYKITKSPKSPSDNF